MEFSYPPVPYIKDFFQIYFPLWEFLEYFWGILNFYKFPSSVFFATETLQDMLWLKRTSFSLSVTLLYFCFTLQIVRGLPQPQRTQRPRRRTEWLQNSPHNTVILFVSFVRFVAKCSNQHSTSSSTQLHEDRCFVCWHFLLVEARVERRKRFYFRVYETVRRLVCGVELGAVGGVLSFVCCFRMGLADCLIITNCVTAGWTSIATWWIEVRRKATEDGDPSHSHIEKREMIWWGMDYLWTQNKKIL